MRKIVLCGLGVLLVAAASAQGMIVLSLSPQTAVNDIDPVLGGSRLVDIVMTADSQGLVGFSTLMQATDARLTVDTASPLTAYNTPTWDASVSFPLSNLTGLSPGPSAMIGIGLLVAPQYDVTSRAATIKVNIAPKGVGGQTVTLSTNSLDRIDGDFMDNTGEEVSLVFTYTPEPATALLLLGALPFLRRRSA